MADKEEQVKRKSRVGEPSANLAPLLIGLLVVAIGEASRAAAFACSPAAVPHDPREKEFHHAGC
jgi:hypothetical protein